MKKLIKKLRIKRETFQALYMITFMFLGLGIAGNIETGAKIPTYGIILYIITGTLTFCKIIYCSRKNK